MGRSAKAAKTDVFQATKTAGRTGPDATPLLCIELDGVLPMRIALRPVDVLSLGNWLNAQRPLAARRVADAERARERRHVDDDAGGGEPNERSSLARLL